MTICVYASIDLPYWVLLRAKKLEWRLLMQWSKGYVGFFFIYLYDFLGVLLNNDVHVNNFKSYMIRTWLGGAVGGIVRTSRFEIGLWNYYEEIQRSHILTNNPLEKWNGSFKITLGVGRKTASSIFISFIYSSFSDRPCYRGLEKWVWYDWQNHPRGTKQTDALWRKAPAIKRNRYKSRELWWYNGILRRPSACGSTPMGIELVDINSFCLFYYCWC